MSISEKWENEMKKLDKIELIENREQSGRILNECPYAM